MKLPKKFERFGRTRKGPMLLTAACVLIGGTAVANFGPTGLVGQSYMGQAPDFWFEGNPCADEAVFFSPNPVLPGIFRWEIDGVAAEEDGDPNTYLRCRLLRPDRSIYCQAGLPDGSVIACSEPDGPYQLPQPGEVVLMTIDTYPGSTECEITISTGFRYGIADPKCREQSGSGGGGNGGSGNGSGGSNNSSGTCNASNAAAVLTTGQMTTIASNACVRLVNETSWSTINPKIQAMSGTASYPVPYTATSCSGTATGSLTGNWVERFLVDGPGVTPNNYCDVFVKLQGNGSQVQFSYFQ